MFWKKKKPFGELHLGVEVKRCAECKPPILRPCLADGKSALFHRWMDEDKGLLKINAYTRPSEQESLYRYYQERGIVTESCSVQPLRSTFALVEFSDGSMGKVPPERIRFLDREEG